ncbi:MAG TPA: hypothetical protein DDW94_11100 [Deltaproteobacteria bacterium]|nr:MAG: hypothetical protein A2Z79_11280 [Deltaproteobacteria bacterium GWA2_55_82]OGQ63456.1 MAG: hypothetical protein A3I81_05465 [Deltaproteobacteria bacterium RIFCSPLOWO2_02_FULL_55_12]OIJ74837.1 MAG: hypothetical protein A2V21_311520 [Deltaproteobacteria bacterium GWC2_55_46]HBG47517.1 hypothetical protein [Deltaproteobacteria bacterium]HCY11533.1 hypothetical protein [Deltaproteobacteria bacterium]
MNFLFLAKNRPFAGEAAELLRLNSPGSEIVFGERGEEFPARLLDMGFDYTFSYISPWVVPEAVLRNTRAAALNFHPGPPEYPGTGCTNFAIYNCEREYGITVHHMEKSVDTGGIVHVERFPIFKADTVHSVTQRAYAHLYTAFIRISGRILSGQPLPESGERWKRKPYTRKELEELCRITRDMPDDEIKRRIKATSYPGMPGAYMELGGVACQLKVT